MYFRSLLPRAGAVAWVFSALAVPAAAACASDGTAPGSSGNSGGTSSGGGSNNDAATVDVSAEPRPVCKEVATDGKVGQGCSGSGSGQDLCVVPGGSQCGANQCVYDTRIDNTFRFYCAPTCAVGGAEQCPLGFSCAAPSASCAQGAAGVCARDTAWSCDSKVDVSGMQIFEGPLGEPFALRIAAGKASLLSLSAAPRELVTWDEASASVVSVVRAGSRGLLLTGTKEIAFDANVATVAARADKPQSATFGALSDGSFVALQTSGGSFAALHKRGADGRWTEVGPTRKRIGALVALGSGFLAQTEGELLVSADGENFEAVPSPTSAPLQAGALVAAGRASDDFYVVVAGGLHRFYKGKWLVEGPKSGATPTGGRGDLLRVSQTGTVAFHTWNGQSYTSFVAAGKGCWRSSQLAELERYPLAGDHFVFAASAGSRDKGLCRLPAR